MNLRTWLACGLLLALAFSPLISADERTEQMLKKVDTDGDGKLSLEEFKARGGQPERAEKMFKRLDKNGDGFINADELQERQPASRKNAAKTDAAKPEVTFEKADKNADGKLDADEFKATIENPKRADALFQRIDKDSDKFLSPAEFEAAAAAMARTGANARKRKKPESAKPEPAKPEAANPEPAKPEPAKPEKTSPDATKPESPAASEKPAAAIEGLRNTERDPLKVSEVIDREIEKKLADKSIAPSALIDDYEFIRRLSLDVRGRIPDAAETEAFAGDSSPDKRRKLIDEFLADPDYGTHFSIVWYRRMVKPDADNRAVISTTFRDWLAERFNANQGWDRLTTDILTASGDRNQNPATVFWLSNTEGKGRIIAENKVATAASQLFLGVKLECCECHNHPFDTELKQTDFWATAAFFTTTHTDGTQKKAVQQDGAVPGVFENQTADRPRGKASKEFAPAGSIVIPESKGTVVSAKFLLQDKGPEAGSQLRPAFAAWLTSTENPYFAKAAANRLWASFFGRGVIDPADDLRSTEGATHPELLDALAAEMAASHFDLKHLIRCVCNSRTYQRSSLPLPENKDDDELYSHMPLRMLTADMLFDSLTVAMSHEPVRGKRPAGKVKAGGNRARTPRDEFLAYFHAEADDDASILEAYTHGIPQVLRLMNSDELNDTERFVKKLVQSSQGPQQVIESIYLTVLSRKPTEAELARMQEYVAASSDSTTGAGELMWALLNSSEFLFNH